MEGDGTAYESRRMANVRRNLGRMQELGVERLAGRTGRRAKPGGPEEKSKRRRSEQVLPSRQSARLRNVPAVSYALPEDDFEDGESAKSRSRSRKRSSEPSTSAKRERVVPPDPSPDSCRALAIDAGHWRNVGLVGRKLWPSHGLGPKGEGASPSPLPTAVEIP